MTDDLALYNNELKRRRCLAVLEHQVAGMKTQQACEAVDLPRSTFYRWIAEGVLADDIEEARSSRTEQIVAQATLAAPDIIHHLIRIATGTVEVRGASPIKAAEVLLNLANMTASAAPPKAGVTNYYLPEQMIFRVEKGAPVTDDQGHLIVDGEYTETDTPEEQDQNGISSGVSVTDAPAASPDS